MSDPNHGSLLREIDRLSSEIDRLEGRLRTARGLILKVVDGRHAFDCRCEYCRFVDEKKTDHDPLCDGCEECGRIP